MPRLRDLLKTFLYLGATAYGGPAMMYHVRQTLVQRRKWLTDAEFMDGMSFVQMLPGATLVQLCTYCGLRLRGWLGALIAPSMFLLTTFVLMLLLSDAYFRFGGVPAVDAVFRGLGAIVAAFILNGAYTMGRAIVTDWQAGVIAVAGFVLLYLKVDILLVVAAGAALGYALYYLPQRFKGTAAPAGRGGGQ